VFAPNVTQDEHIGRLRAADLALDVLPYGSHTTGSDALWAGVPLLTCRGATFAGRVGASLLAAVGLPELVTESVEAYAEALLALLADRGRLAGYRAHLEAGRAGFALFDTAGFTRDFEHLLMGAVETGIAGSLSGSSRSR
jgi:predicted O-linked N-acetylglucosamine transferase (SPINDLY family)